MLRDLNGEMGWSGVDVGEISSNQHFAATGGCRYRHYPGYRVFIPMRNS